VLVPEISTYVNIIISLFLYVYALCICMARPKDLIGTKISMGKQNESVEIKRSEEQEVKYIQSKNICKGLKTQDYLHRKAKK
jgi:hypothetical protein